MNAMDKILASHTRNTKHSGNTATASTETVAVGNVGSVNERTGAHSIQRVGLLSALAGVDTLKPLAKPAKQNFLVLADTQVVPSRYKYPFVMPEGTWHIIVDFMRH